MLIKFEKSCPGPLLSSTPVVHSHHIKVGKPNKNTFIVIKILYFQLPCVCISCRAESQVEENCRYHTTYRNRLKLSGRMTVQLCQGRFEQQSEKQKAFGYSANHRISFSSNYNKFSVRHLGSNQSIFFFSNLRFDMCKHVQLKVRLFLFSIYSIVFYCSADKMNIHLRQVSNRFYYYFSSLALSCKYQCSDMLRCQSSCMNLERYHCILTQLSEIQL